MTSLSDQFSAVRKAQFDFFQAMTAQALDSAGRVAALNMALSRDAVQRSLGATAALIGIAGGMRPYALRPQAPALAPAQAIETVDVTGHDRADIATEAVEAAAAPASVSEPVVVLEAAAAPQAASEALDAVAEPVPVAEPKAIAKAAGKGTARAAAAPRPAAAPVASLASTGSKRKK